MGHVVSFIPKAGAGQSKTLSTGDAAAIIIFPGVRYERVPEKAASAGKAPVTTPQKSPKH